MAEVYDDSVALLAAGIQNEFQNRVVANSDGKLGSQQFNFLQFVAPEKRAIIMRELASRGRPIQGMLGSSGSVPLQSEVRLFNPFMGTSHQQLLDISKTQAPHPPVAGRNTDEFQVPVNFSLNPLAESRKTDPEPATNYVPAFQFPGTNPTISTVSGKQTAVREISKKQYDLLVKKLDTILDFVARIADSLGLEDVPEIVEDPPETEPQKEEPKSTPNDNLTHEIEGSFPIFSE